MRSAITPSRSACSTSHGFWDGLDGFMDHVRDSGFLSEARRGQLLKAETPGAGNRPTGRRREKRGTRHGLVSRKRVGIW